MCDAVSADYDSVDFKDDDDSYFMKYSWTADQEGEFIEWLADYLYTDKEARVEFMEWPRKNKKLCHNKAYWFTWNHGWRVDR